MTLLAMRVARGMLSSSRPLEAREIFKVNSRTRAGVCGALVLWIFFCPPSGAAQDGLMWSTFLGGGDADYGYDIAMDSSGSAWVTGFTQSADFPTAAGAFDTTLDNRDLFVTKLAPQGDALVQSTFLGGNSSDEGFSLALDDEGNAYVIGYTQSVDFPITPGALDSVLGGQTDAFVVKLRAKGPPLAYATFLGGSADEMGMGIAVDGAGTAFLIGYTESGDFPTTEKAFDRTHNGAADVFVARLDLSSGALEYATFLGGSSNDAGWGIVLDDGGSANIVGYTYSDDFPTTAGAFDTTLGGPTDVFVARLDPSGSALFFSTLLGGSSREVARSIAVDDWGNAHVTGGTFSQDFPTTAGAFDTVMSLFDLNAFVTKFTPGGGDLAYSTFLGGEGDDVGYGIVLDSSGKTCVIGFTEAADFPTTSGAFDATHNGQRDIFVSLLNKGGSALDYSTFLGGSDAEYGWDVLLDGSGNAYLAGYTRSADFPTTAGAFDETHNGGEDVFVLKINLDGSVPVESGTPPRAMPKSCVLYQNHPNPFNAGTEISYAIPMAMDVILRIYNVLGAEVATLVEGHRPAGFHTEPWHAGDLASGVYFCTIAAGDFRQTIKMVLLK